MVTGRCLVALRRNHFSSLCRDLARDGAGVWKDWRSRPRLNLQQLPTGQPKPAWQRAVSWHRWETGKLAGHRLTVGTGSCYLSCESRIRLRAKVTCHPGSKSNNQGSYGGELGCWRASDFSFLFCLFLNVCVKRIASKHF